MPGTGEADDPPGEAALKLAAMEENIDRRLACEGQPEKRYVDDVRLIT